MKHTVAAALMALLLANGAVGCSTTDVADDAGAPVLEEDSVGYAYFGSLEVARGTTINTVVDKVESSSDINVTSAPDGVTVSILEADDGTTRIELAVASDAPIGGHALTFNIAGEPDPVSWTILIT